MIDTTWIMSPRPVVPWGLRKALNWVRLEGFLSLIVFVADLSLLSSYSVILRGKMLVVDLIDHFLGNT